MNSSPTDPKTLERLAELERENRLLREQNRQAERIRHMWQESVKQLKTARRSLLETQEALQRSNEELRDNMAELSSAKKYAERLAYSDHQVIENMQEGLIVTDAEGAILAINPAFSEMTGYGLEEVSGQKPNLLKSGHHDDQFYRQMWQALLEQGRWQGEIWNKRKDGSVFPELLSISAIRDWRNDTINYIGIFTDISEQKQHEEQLRQSREQLDAVTSLLSEAVLLVEGDEIIAFANPEAAHLTGIPLQQMMQQPLSEICKIAEPRGRFLLPAGMIARDYLDSRASQVFEDVHLFRNDGTTLPVSLAATPIIRDNEIVGSVVAFHDVSQRKETEEQLRKLSRAVEHSPSMVIITDLSGLIEYVNPRFSEITGYSADEVIGRPTNLLKSGETPPEVYEDLWETINKGEDWRGEFQNRRKDGKLYWQMVSISPIVDTDGNITHFVSVEEDITERKRSEEKIWHQANFDSLTGLPNRRLFQDRLRQAIMQARRSDHTGALMFIDLDRFKFVNDTIGHEAGDELLQCVSRRLLDIVRESDTVARLGGDEFTIVLPEIRDIDAVESIARKSLEVLERPVHLKGQEIFISGSIGITVFPDDAETVEDVLKNADTAMYRAKHAGRNTYSFFTEEFNQQTLRKISIENALRRALERHELSVEFQPKVNTVTQRVIGAEALVRWSNPQLGDVPAGDFIPIAESAGLMSSIGSWVLEKACSEAQRWRQDYDPRLVIAVNVSMAQLRNEGCLKQLEKVLQKTGLPPQNLELEVTESVMMDDADYYANVLERITDMGVRIAIDDFGTGYSSFDYLRRLKAKNLKIDHTFIRDLPEDADSVTIVHTIIDVAHNLKMAVTAEGVENEAQLHFLQRAGCEYSQGFLFGRSLCADKFRQFLQNSPTH